MLRKIARAVLGRFSSTPLPGERSTASTHELGHGPAFEDFRFRARGAAFTGFPAAWIDAAPALSHPAPVCAVLHVVAPEELPAALRELGAIDVPFDLIITNPTGAPLDVSAATGTGARSVRVLDVERLGEHALPLACVVNAGLIDPYDLVFRARVTHRSAATEGTTVLPASLLGDAANVRDVLQALRENPAVGTVSADGTLAGDERWDGHRDAVAQLARRLEVRTPEHDVRFAVTTDMWMRGFLLQGLRALELDRADFEAADDLPGDALATAVERLIGVLTAEAGLHAFERGAIRAEEAQGRDELTAALRAPARRARAIARFLPTFDPVPDDAAPADAAHTAWPQWGEIAATTPLFGGHTQPLLPGELGFYDQRTPGVHDQQAALAHDAGIDAFVYDYAWFGGDDLSADRVERLLTRSHDLPFCLLWTNETPPRRDDGRNAAARRARRHPGAPAEQFIDDVMHLLLDPRYWRIDGAAVVAVYNLGFVPDHERVLTVWRERAREAGVGELHIVCADVAGAMAGGVPPVGVDRAVAFPPHGHEQRWWHGTPLEVSTRMRGHLLDYRVMVEESERSLLGELPAALVPGVAVAHDDTSRHSHAPDVWVGANPYTFRRWLASSVAAVADRPAAERTVFLASWNDWPTCAVLEPTDRWGRTYLQAVRSALH